MPAILCLRTFFLGALFTGFLGLCGTLQAVEILTNEKLLKAVQAGVSLDVILNLINDNLTNSQFDSSTDALIALQEAGIKGAWKPEQISTLQTKIIDVAKLDTKRINGLVSKALNVFENSDENEYEQVMRELVRVGMGIVPELLKNMEQESERKRSGVVDAIGQIGDKSDSVIKAVLLMLFDRSKPVRLAAAKCVASLARPEDCATLISKLSLKNVKLDGVAMALGYLGDARAIEPLVSLLKLSGDSDARNCAAFSLGQLRAKTPSATDCLLEAVLDERDEKLRESAAQALALIGDPRAPRHIIRAFQRYRQGREDLLKHLAYFKDGEAVEFLLDEIDKEDSPKIKKAALETLRILSHEDYESIDDWRSWWSVSKVRPDWIRTEPELPKVRDPRGSDRSLLKDSAANESIPTSR